MNNIYRALLKLMIVPLLLYVAATSGIAAKIVVDEIGARKLQKERSATMITFRECGSRSSGHGQSQQLLNTKSSGELRHLR